MNDLENFDKLLLNLIDKSMVHMLYKDELGSIFLLTKYFEIYMKDDDVLGVYSWNTNAYKEVKQYAVQDPAKALDIHCFEVSTDHLDKLLDAGTHKRRIHRT